MILTRSVCQETEAEAKPHHEPTLADTIAGAALKVQGLLTGSSGKKVGALSLFCEGI